MQAKKNNKIYSMEKSPIKYKSVKYKPTNRGVWSLNYEPTHTEVYRPTKRKPFNYFERIIMKGKVVFTYKPQVREDIWGAIASGGYDNFLKLNVSELKASSLRKTSTVDNKEAKIVDGRNLIKVWGNLIQNDQSFINIIKSSTLSSEGDFNIFKTLQHTYDGKLSYLRQYLHPVTLSKHSGVILLLNAKNNIRGKVNSHPLKYLSIPVVYKDSSENTIKLPWFFRLPCSSIFVVNVPETLTFYFISFDNWINFIQFNFIRIANKFSWSFLSEIEYLKKIILNRNFYFINLYRIFRKVHLLNILRDTNEIYYLPESLFENTLPFLTSANVKARKAAFSTNSGLLSEFALIKLGESKNKNWPVVVKRIHNRFIKTLIVLKFIKKLYLSKFKLQKKFNSILFNIITLGWSVFSNNLKAKLSKPIKKLNLTNRKVINSFVSFWLRARSLKKIPKISPFSKVLISQKAFDLKRSSADSLTIRKLKLKIYRFSRRFIFKGLKTFEWKFFDRKWYFKYSRWKYSVLFKMMIRKAWNNYRKINKNFLFVKFFKVHIFNILGLKDWDLWCLWRSVRFGNNINYYSSTMDRFNQLLQLKLDSLVLLLNIMPNRPLAQEFVKFGSLRISGSVITDFNKSLYLNDILQIELSSAIKIKKLYNKIGRFHEDKTKLYNIHEVIRNLPFLQVLSSYMLIMLVRYPSKYEMMSESILSDRWIRFYIRYFPIRMSKYSKPKTKWIKY